MENYLSPLIPINPCSAEPFLCSHHNVWVNWGLWTIINSYCPLIVQALTALGNEMSLSLAPLSTSLPGSINNNVKQVLRSILIQCWPVQPLMNLGSLLIWFSRWLSINLKIWFYCMTKMKTLKHSPPPGFPSCRIPLPKCPGPIKDTCYVWGKKQQNRQHLDVLACNSANKRLFKKVLVRVWKDGIITELSTKISRSAVFASCIAGILKWLWIDTYTSPVRVVTNT